MPAKLFARQYCHLSFFSIISSSSVAAANLFRKNRMLLHFSTSACQQKRLDQPKMTPPSITTTTNLVSNHYNNSDTPTTSESPTSSGQFDDRSLSPEGSTNQNNPTVFIPFPHFATNAIHAGQDAEQWPSWAVVPPISMSTTFKQASPGVYKHDYGCGGNPTRDALEVCLATLEGAKYCSTFASGLSALNALVLLLNTGEEVIAMDDLYGGTNRFFRRIAAPHANIVTHFISMEHKDSKQMAQLMLSKLNERTRLVWIESPTNPTMKMADIELVSRLVHDYRRDIIVAVDNTFMTPYFQRPLALGADCVVHSCTKYLNGHSDVIMGCIMMNDDALAQRIKFMQYAAGGVPSPFDCFLLNRGLKTLHVRMERHMQNGLAVARALERNMLRVQRVTHPGLESYPQRALAQRQCRGYSGMIGFYINNGTVRETRRFLEALKVWTLAESLGGYESLAEVPSLMTHLSVPPEQRIELGITDNFIRLSTGLEDVQDLIEDLMQALEVAFNTDSDSQTTKTTADITVAK